MAYTEEFISSHDSISHASTKLAETEIAGRTSFPDDSSTDSPLTEMVIRPPRRENLVLPLALLLTLAASTVAFAPSPDKPIIDINILKILGDLGGALVKVPENVVKSLPAIKAFYFDNGLLGHLALGGTAGLIFKTVESVKEKGFLVGLAHLFEKDTLEKMFTGAVIVAVFDNLSGIKDAFDFSIKQVSLANFAKIGAALGVGVKAISEIVAHHKISLSEANFKELGLSAVDGASILIVAGTAARFSEILKGSFDAKEAALYAIPLGRLTWPIVKKLRD